MGRACTRLHTQWPTQAGIMSSEAPTRNDASGFKAQLLAQLNPAQPTEHASQTRSTTRTPDPANGGGNGTSSSGQAGDHGGATFPIPLVPSAFASMLHRPKPSNLGGTTVPIEQGVPGSEQVKGSEAIAAAQRAAMQRLLLWHSNTKLLAAVSTWKVQHFRRYACVELQRMCLTSRLRSLVRGRPFICSPCGALRGSPFTTCIRSGAHSWCVGGHDGIVLTGACGLACCGVAHLDCLSPGPAHRQSEGLAAGLLCRSVRPRWFQQ